MNRTAAFSRDRRYRYRLDRRWADGPAIAWVILNPSTADDTVDDPTIRRCIGFSQRWGYGGMTVVNLFAWRTPNPSALSEVADPVGHRNDVALQEVLREADAVVAAWGNVPSLLGSRVARALALLGDDTLCLGLTGRGHPRHPLYVRADQSPRRLAAAPAEADPTLVVR